MYKLAIAALAATVAAGLSLAPTPAASQQVTLRLHTFVPPVANPAKTFLVPWAEKVTAASKGRLKVQVFPSMQLGGRAPQLLDQVRDGVVDIVWTVPGFTAGRMPKLEIFELPFIHKDAKTTTFALQDYAAKHLMRDELKDYKVLLVHAHSGFLFMTKDPLEKLADFKGLRIRAPSRTHIWALEALGASPVGTELNELPPMLSKGVVSGSVLPYEIAPAVQMHELVNYFTVLSPPQPRMGTTVFTFLMNKASYEKLPADLKKVIDDHSGQNIAKWAADNWDAIELAGEKVMRSKSKNKFATIGPEETAKIRQASRAAYDKFNAAMKSLGHDGDKLIGDARAMIDKHAK